MTQILKKHEREAIEAIREVARRHGVQTKTITRGRHPRKVVLTCGANRAVIGLPSSPNDAFWAVRVAIKQAEQACAGFTSASAGSPE